MISMDSIKAYHCPRWDELPDLDLYMDQVMSVLEKNLSVFVNPDPAKAITPTMINNYVKQKLVEPPKNKKYNRGHIASFYIITLLKQIMSITEINTAINCVVEKTSPKEGYDLFCEVFEDSLRYIFSGKETNEQFRQIKDDEIYEMIKSICLAHANMLYARVLLNKHMPVLPEKEDKKEEKKDKKDKKEDKKEKNKQ